MKTPSPLARVRSFVIDLDGVVYRGKIAIPGAGRFLEALQTGSVPFLLLTNNSTSSDAQVVAKLADMGIEVEQGCILTGDDGPRSRQDFLRLTYQLSPFPMLFRRGWSRKTQEPDW